MDTDDDIIIAKQFKLKSRGNKKVYQELILNRQNLIKALSNSVCRNDKSQTRSVSASKFVWRIRSKS